MILVGVSLVPSVADLVEVARCEDGSTHNTTTSYGDCNVTGAAYTVTGLITLFFALAIASAGIAVAANGLRAAGVL